MNLAAALWLAVFSCAAGAAVTWHVANALRDDEVEHVRVEWRERGYRSCLSEQDEDKPRRGR